MKKTTVHLFFTLSIALLGCLYSFGQEKIYYPSQKSSFDDFNVEISNIVGLATELKFKIEIENTSSDFLFFDASKCVFTINGTSVVPKDKFIIIEPYQKKSKTVTALGSNFNTIREFKFELNGIQKVVLTDETFPTEVFLLPPNKNDFATGPFSVELKNFKKETGATLSKFNAQYKGKKIGFVFPSKVSTSMPDGKDYANGKKADPVLLFPGESAAINANWERMPGGSVNDMQKVEMKLNFTEVFREGTTVDLKSQLFSFTWDEAVTKEKNK
jgi:hypothetical protein